LPHFSRSFLPGNIQADDLPVVCSVVMETGCGSKGAVRNAGHRNRNRRVDRVEHHLKTCGIEPRNPQLQTYFYRWIILNDLTIGGNP